MEKAAEKKNYHEMKQTILIYQHKYDEENKHTFHVAAPKGSFAVPLTSIIPFATSIQESNT